MADKENLREKILSLAENDVDRDILENYVSKILHLIKKEDE